MTGIQDLGKRRDQRGFAFETTATAIVRSSVLQPIVSTSEGLFQSEASRK